MLGINWLEVTSCRCSIPQWLFCQPCWAILAVQVNVSSRKTLHIYLSMKMSHKNGFSVSENQRPWFLNILPILIWQAGTAEGMTHHCAPRAARAAPRRAAAGTRWRRRGGRRGGRARGRTARAVKVDCAGGYLAVRWDFFLNLPSFPPLSFPIERLQREDRVSPI